MDKFVVGLLFDYDLNHFLLIDKGKTPTSLSEGVEGNAILTSLK